MKLNLKKTLSVGLIVLTLAVVLFVGIRSGDFPASMRAMLSIPPQYVLLSILCTFGGILMQTLSARSALRKLGHRVPFPRLYAICVLGEFYSFITPGASGGQPMQVWQFHRCRTPVGDATAALTVHFHCFQLTLLTLDVALYAIHGDFIRAQLGANLPFLFIGYAATAAIVGGSLMIAFYQRPIRFLLTKVSPIMRRFKIGDPDRLQDMLSGLADGFYVSIRRLETDRLEILRQVLIALARLVMMMSIIYFIYRGLGMTSVGYDKIVTMGCMQYTSAAYTPLPGSSGAQEGLFSLYFQSLLPDSLLLSGLLAWRFITYYMVIIVGFFVTTALGMRNLSVDEAQAEMMDDFQQEMDRND